MISALYFDLSGRTNVDFDLPLLTEVKQQIPGIITFDLDTRSDPSMTAYAHQLLKDSEKAVIFMEASPDISPRILSILEEVAGDPQKFLMFLEGENRWVEKLFSTHDNFLHEDLSSEEKLRLIKAFFKTGL